MARSPSLDQMTFDNWSKTSSKLSWQGILPHSVNEWSSMCLRDLEGVTSDMMSRLAEVDWMDASTPDQFLNEEDLAIDSEDQSSGQRAAIGFRRSPDGTYSCLYILVKISFKASLPQSQLQMGPSITRGELSNSRSRKCLLGLFLPSILLIYQVGVWICRWPFQFCVMVWFTFWWARPLKAFFRKSIDALRVMPGFNRCAQLARPVVNVCAQLARPVVSMYEQIASTYEWLKGEYPNLTNSQEVPAVPHHSNPLPDQAQSMDDVNSDITNLILQIFKEEGFQV